jgi:hypothetical protein
VAEKKENKAIENGMAKSKQEKQKNWYQELVKGKCEEKADLHLTPPQPMADIEAPDGFRAVSMSQALMTFAKPLMDIAGDCNIEGLNEIFQISIFFWNYEILEREGSNQAGEIKKKIMAAMKGILGLRVAESEELLQKMLDRKRNLFPEDIQPKHSPVVFVTKEAFAPHCLIQL